MKRHLRICMLAPGANVHTRRWVGGLSKRGHEVLLIPQEGDDPGIDTPVFDPYRLMGPLRHLPKIRALVAERMIVNRVEDYAPDVTHLHWLNASAGTLRLLRRLGPFVVSVWGRDVIWDGSRRESTRRILLKRRLLNLASKVTATSHFLAERTRQYLDDDQKVYVISFGVDCSQFRPGKAHGNSPTPVIGFLKHYTPKYGPDVLLQAVALLAREGLKFHLQMYGSRDAAPYRRLARSLMIEPHITFAGVVPHDQVPSVMQRFDIYVMPSVVDSESFGVAALEASACGLPVVASRVGGVPEVVQHEQTGLLVPPAEPAALATALRRLLLDPNLRLTLGAAGVDFVRRHYGWQDSIDRMERLYLEMARERAT